MQLLTDVRVALGLGGGENLNNIFWRIVAGCRLAPRVA